MAENALHPMGVPKPAWLPQDVYDALLFARRTAGEAARPVHATDLQMIGAAAKGAVKAVAPH